MSNPPTAGSPLRALSSASSWLERLVLATVLVAIAAASWYLLPFWRESPELSHGYFAPFCALALLWRSRREPTTKLPFGGDRTGPALHCVAAVCGIAIAGIAALAALVQGPLHSQTAFLVGIAASAFVLSGVLALARSPSRWMRLNGASLCAVILWWFVVPIPSGTLARTSLFLQNLITTASVKTLVMLGMAAVQHGNTIQLPNAVVGVEEACSGIRSLTACLFAGVVFGGWMLKGIPRRFVVILGAGALAIIMNFLRSITLCLLVAGGFGIRGFWHDAIGYAELGATALGVFAACRMLSSGSSAPASQPADNSPRSGALFGLLVHSAYAGLVLLFALLAFGKMAPGATHERPPPDLHALMAIDCPGWTRRSDAGIAAFSQQLNTSCLRQETYNRGDTQVTFYIAFWSSRQATLGSVALHTPDICLPGGGWIPQPVPPPIGHYPLPSPRRFAFEMGTYPQHVWFWHYFDGRLMNPAAGLYPWQLAPALLRRGISASAPQWVVRVSSNRPLEALLDEALLQEFFARFRVEGLAGDSGKF